MGWADALQGAGAWLQGSGPQYMQAQALQDEARAKHEAERQKAMLTDFVMAESMLKNGQVQPAIAMFRSRVEAGKKLPPIQSLGGSMGTSEHYLGLLESGNIDQAFKEIATGNQVLRDAGVLPEVSAAEGAKRTDVFKNGAVLQATSDGSIRLTTPSGASVGPSDPSWQQAISEATGSGIQYAGDEAAARAMGQGNVQIQIDPVIAELVSRAKAGVEGETKPQIEQNTQKAKLLVDRANARLETGLASASTLPSLYRMSELLETVNTGGFANVTAKAQSMFGVLPKDTAELQNLMGRNVLSQLKASFGGNPTEREGAFLAEIEASLNKGTGANKATIDNAIKLLELRAQNGKKAAKYLEDQDSADEIDGYLKLKLGDKSTEKKVVRRGVDKATGKRVVQYDDGTVVPE